MPTAEETAAGLAYVFMMIEEPHQALPDGKTDTVRT